MFFHGTVHFWEDLTETALSSEDLAVGMLLVAQCPKQVQTWGFFPRRCGWHQENCRTSKPGEVSESSSFKFLRFFFFFLTKNLRFREEKTRAHLLAMLVVI